MATIVFCEDQGVVRELIWVAMKPTPHLIKVAADGQEGLELIVRMRPQLIVTDVVMPRMGGFKLAAAVRHAASLRHIPIVFMTASLQPDEIGQFAAHGAIAHIAKPFSPNELRETISDVLTGTRQHMDARFATVR
ncbi:MAG: response regulator [Chloroflexi bacterium]|nr:MAG: response regulator [Chloroflexota bacterium]TMC27930.1 MAG: response regulator [Chloroflexota bacterium]